MLASMVCAAGVGIGYAAMPTLILGGVPLSEAGAAVGLQLADAIGGHHLGVSGDGLVLTSSSIDVGGVASRRIRRSPGAS